MPGIIFWNIARSGGSMEPLSGTNLCEDLAGLAETYRPDLIILCECQAGFDDHPEQLPSGFCFVKPANPRLYTGDTMLRYAVISRLGFGGRSRLVRTTPLDNRLRPAIAVVGTSLRLIALHAASISSSNTVQLGQLVHAHDEFRKSGAVADLLIGDFNIDLAMHRAYVGGKLKGTSLEHFSPRCSRQGTHRSSGRQHESILDWVLVKPALQGQISIRAIQGTKRTQEEKKQDRYLKLEFENRKNSDHRPIMASW